MWPKIVLPAQELLWLFVDDSNVWVEGQRLAARLRSLQENNDARFRVDLGGLMRLACRTTGHLPGKTEMAHAFLYGSRPPANDSVWQEARRNKFKVQIFDRMNGTPRGKEKEVDHAIAVDMTDEAARIHYRSGMGDQHALALKSAATFVVVTGDRDMRPAIKRVLAFGIRVRLLAYVHSLSQEYRKLAAESPLFKVVMLDQHLEAISFTNFFSTRKPTNVDQACALTLDLQLADLGDCPIETACTRLLRTQAMFYVTELYKTGRPQDAHMLCIEFPNKDLHQVITRCRQLFPAQAVQAYMMHRANRERHDDKDSVLRLHRSAYAALANPNDQEAEHTDEEDGESSADKKHKGQRASEAISDGQEEAAAQPFPETEEDVSPQTSARADWMAMCSSLQNSGEESHGDDNDDVGGGNQSRKEQQAKAKVIQPSVKEYAMASQSEKQHAHRVNSHEQQPPCCSSDEDVVGGVSDQTFCVVRPRRTAAQRHMHTLRRGTRCPNGVHCDRALDCPMKHDAADIRIFRKYQSKTGFRFKLWKSARCDLDRPHGHAELCAYSHGKEAGDDEWCLHCRAWGHLQVACAFVRKKAAKSPGAPRSSRP